MPDQFKHEHRYGPYSTEVLAGFDDHDGKTLVKCVCGFERKKREQMAKHLNGNKGCYYSRINKYWRANGFTTIANGTRFIGICDDLGLDIYLDQRAYQRGSSGWETWAPEWAVGIFHDYLGRTIGRRQVGGLSRTDVCKRGLDNPKDWMLRTLLGEAKKDVEFRSAVRAAQRLKVRPEDQCVQFKIWLVERGHTIPKNLQPKTEVADA